MWSVLRAALLMLPLSVVAADAADPAQAVCGHAQKALVIGHVRPSLVGPRQWLRAGPACGQQHTSTAGADGQHPGAIDGAAVAFEHIDQWLRLVELAELNHRLDRVGHE